MARAQKFDFLHNMRFHVTLDTAGPAGGVGWDDAADFNKVSQTTTAQAGFSAVTIPEVTNEIVEYREGQYLYTRKFLGIPSFNDCTLSRGVTMKDTGFWGWIYVSLEGTKEYRTDVTILHYHRANTLPGHGSGKDTLALDGASNRKYILHEAIPSRHKFASDLDATDSAVSIMELDVAYEHCEIIEGSF